MKSKIVIEIDTEFKPFIMEDDFEEPEDYKKDVQDTFHNKLFELIEEFIIDEEGELQREVIEAINEEYLSNNSKEEELKEYGQLGKVHIDISQDVQDLIENVEVKNENK
jgi:hypothetical protein